MVLSSAKVKVSPWVGVHEMNGVLALSGTTSESSVPLPCGIVAVGVTMSGAGGAGTSELLEVMLRARGLPT
jgi:hypothetical protein